MTSRRSSIGVLVAVACALLAASSLAAASSSVYAPLDRPGPALDVPDAMLAAALQCTGGVAGAARDPILLVPGTNLDPQSNYAWNYERAFTALGWPYCTIALPYKNMGDIQVAGQYLVFAIRTVHELSGRPIDILGFSQGGMLPRWALRFWPDTRPMVNAFVALDPSNHGTLDAWAVCHVLCPPAYWQQATGSHFLDALNSDAETFAGISYTVVYSRADEVVTPNLDADGSSSLHTGDGAIADIAVQDICPADLSDHLAMGSYDPVAYALAIDAFSHGGLADSVRIPRSVCLRPFQPGVNPATFVADYAEYDASIGAALLQSPEVWAEPPLASYVFG
ncbi:MAG TPA: lipase [Candidatus Dormibacteraeota bacterium]